MLSKGLPAGRIHDPPIAECDKIRRNFWDRILTDMQDLGMPGPENTRTFLITGLVNEKAAGQDQAGMLMIAWRCLYAEVVKARLEGGNLNFDNAYRRVIEMTISRLQAHGTKWRRWYMSIRKTSKAQPFPKKHRTRILMNFEADATYEVSGKLLDIRKKAREDAGIDTGTGDKGDRQKNMPGREMEAGWVRRHGGGRGGTRPPPHRLDVTAPANTHPNPPPLRRNPS